MGKRAEQLIKGWATLSINEAVMGNTKWRRGACGASLFGGIELDACSEIINLVRWGSKHLLFTLLYVSLTPQPVEGHKTRALRDFKKIIKSDRT